MSVIRYEGKDIGALAEAVMRNNDYMHALKNVHDHYDEKQFKMSEKDIQNRVLCFFDRLYIANQLAEAISYPSKDGIITLQRLQDTDMGGMKFASTHLNGPRALNSALRSMRYNIVSNGGRSFFDQEDSERLNSLIELTANMVLDATERRGA